MRAGHARKKLRAAGAAEITRSGDATLPRRGTAVEAGTAEITRLCDYETGAVVEAGAVMERTCRSCYFRACMWCSILEIELPILTEHCDCWRDCEPTDWSTEKH